MVKLNDKLSSEKKDLLLKILCYLIPFIVLSVYFIYTFFQISSEEISGYYLIHYVYTYDHGYLARGLVGEIISWFADTVTNELVFSVVNIFSVLLLTGASLCIGRTLCKLRNDKELFYTALFFIIVICAVPWTFKVYFNDFRLDKVVWMLSLFAVYLSDRKHGIWLVPLICVIATLVNPIYLFLCMVLNAIILLEEFYLSGYSKKFGIICAVSYITMIALGIYGVTSQQNVGFENARELVDFYFSRYEQSLDEATYHAFETQWVVDYFIEKGEVIKIAFDVYFKQLQNGRAFFIDLVFLAIPVYSLLIALWRKIIKNESNKFQKFIYFLCAVSPIVVIPPTLVCWEFSKYVTNNVVVQLCLLIYFVARGNEAVVTTVKDTLRCCRENILLTSAVIAYFSIFMIYWF